ncbi:UNVERIFIED_CONTAM: glycosyltransferase involved in cell wall biosynthesis [Brevibacillus sp. OAP136]
MERRKIAHLTSVHEPTDTRILHKECRTLAQAGYDVVLIAPHDRDEWLNGVRIRAIPQPKSRLGRMLQTTWQVYRTAVKENASVYHFHDPELIGVGVMLKMLGKKVIYDVHEDLPRQILSKEWIPKWLRHGLAVVSEAVEGTAARIFDRIVTVTSTIAERFPAEKTVIVKNYPILGELTTITACPHVERPLCVTYVAAGITTVRGIHEMVHAMEILQHSGIRLILAGHISPIELRDKVATYPGWQCVEEAGYLNREQVGSLLNNVRAGLVTHHPIVNYVDSLPVKMFEYMAAGIPVIASDFPLWREIVEGSDCGLCVDPLSPEQIAEAIRWIVEHPVEAQRMGENGQRAVADRYNWDREANKLLSVYEELSAVHEKTQVTQVR